MKKLFLLLLTVITLSFCASAQTRTVQGTVLDAETDEPLVGASVVADNSQTGVATDYDGNFSLQVNAGAKQLKVSYIGYETKMVNISDGKMTIRLVNDNNLLDPVIVVAYGEQKKSSFTGSAAVVGSASIEKTQVTNVLDALSGKVAGLQLSNSTGAPGSSSPTIRIRGFSSLQAGNAPLVIVDGTPYNGDINDLNTNDIESMSVLKDAASNALYGARGANGVILITTKRAKLGEAQVTVNAKWGVNSRAAVDYDYVKDPKQYYEMFYGALYNYAANTKELDGMGYAPAQAHSYALSTMMGSTGNGLGYNVFTVPEGQQLIGTNGKFNPNATLGYMATYEGQEFWLTPDNWLDETYKTSLRQEYNVSISQGTEKSNFYASIGYLDNQGIITAPSGFRRFTARVSADIQAKPWLKVGANVAYTHSDIKEMDEDGNSASTGNVFAIATQIAPIYPMYMRDGNKQIMVDSRNFPRFDYGAGLNAGMVRNFLKDSNALSDARLNKTESNSNNFTGTGFIEIRFLKDFKFTSNNNVNVFESRGGQIVNPYYGQYAIMEGIAHMAHGRTTDLTFQQLLNWNHMFGRHNVSVLAGHEYYKTTSTSLSASKNHMFDPNNMELDGAIIDGNSASSSYGMYNNEGWIFRGQYDYDSKYFGSASFRRDASSRFHPKHRWGNFWSVGGAWIVTKEDFFQNLDADWVNMLKVKASYGEQGNDQIGAYRYTNTYSLINSNGHPAASPSTKGNETITWEKGGNLNAGIEFDLFNNRLSGGVEAFWRKTSDMLMYFPLPASFGFMGYYDNVGDMTNTGVEIELTGVPVRTKDFTWTINANMTWYKNRITKLPDERKSTGIVYGKEGFSGSGIFYGEGLPMYTFVTKQYAGVDPETGKPMYWRQVRDKETGLQLPERETTTDYGSADQYLCGTALAPVYGGFSTSFEFKGFDLSASFNYQIGGQVMDSNYSSLMASPSGGNVGTNFHADLLKAWTPENPNSNIPRWQFGDKDFNSSSDRWLTNASYLSLENINFGYTLPKNIVSKLYLSKLRVYVAADNIWVWSKRQGLDPRQSFTGGTNNTYYSPMRTISGGLTVSF